MIFRDFSVRATSLFLCFFCFTCISLTAQNSAAYGDRNFTMISKEREKNAEEISNINRMIESLDEKQKNGMYELQAIQKRMNLRESELYTIDRQIGSLRKQLEEKREAVDHLQNHLEELRKSYKDLVNRYYSMQYQKNTFVMYIMASESVSQAYNRMKYVREILLLLQIRAEKITKMTDRLNDEINDISKKESLLSSNVSDRQKEIELLKLDARKSQSVYSELMKDKSTLTKRLQEREKHYELQNAKMREFMRNEFQSNQKNGFADEILRSAKDFEVMKGFLPRPAIGVVLAPFGVDKTRSLYETVKLKSNTGIDIHTAEKAEVYSIFKGRVKAVMNLQGMLNVIIQHGLYYSVYSSLESAFVKTGDEVAARQKIGIVKNSKDGYILHFELWKNTEILDPEKWILN
jgi:septal ring factor EnvC (AmiA/AmiB activator)